MVMNVPFEIQLGGFDSNLLKKKKKKDLFDFLNVF